MKTKNEMACHQKCVKMRNISQERAASSKYDEKHRSNDVSVCFSIVSECAHVRLQKAATLLCINFCNTSYKKVSERKRT